VQSKKFSLVIGQIRRHVQSKRHFVPDHPSLQFVVNWYQVVSFHSRL